MEQSRDSKLIQAREVSEDHLNNMDVFEQHTVSPILQFQSSLIYSQVKNALQEQYKAFHAWNQKEQKRVVKLLLSQDLPLRKSLVHTITSLFTLREFQYYQKHEYEINKRVSKLIMNRLNQNLEKLL